MSATDRIGERLPHFYKTWTRESLIFKVLHSFGNPLDEMERDLVRILRGHWIDTARGYDLDLLGDIFRLHRGLGESDRTLRNRVKRAIQEFKGGGTLPSLDSTLSVLFGPLSRQVRRKEFPETPFSIALEASSGDVWNLKSGGIEDAMPTMRITPETQGEIQDPKMSNLQTGQFVGFRGSLKTGEELLVTGRRASLNGIDASSRLVTSEAPPTIQRGGSEWQYSEALHSKIGVFDSGLFDEALFTTPLAKVGIRIEWEARKTATVEVRVSREQLQKSGLVDEELRRTLNAIKAAGVEIRLKIEEPAVLKPPTPIPTTGLGPSEISPTKPLVSAEVKT